MAFAILLAGSAAVLGLASPATASNGGSAVVTDQNGDPLSHGGSGTEFGLVLPASAACPGDSLHHGWLISSYVAPAAVAPSSIYLPNDYPNTKLDLVTVQQYPYVDEQTVPDTGGIGTPPLFTWGPFSQERSLLPAGTYNVGIGCFLGHHTAARYWNVQFTFTNSRSDPGGFTWTDSAAGRSSSDHTGAVIVLVVLVVGAAGTVIAVAGRGPRRRRPAPDRRARRRAAGVGV